MKKEKIKGNKSPTERAGQQVRTTSAWSFNSISKKTAYKVCQNSIYHIKILGPWAILSSWHLMGKKYQTKFDLFWTWDRFKPRIVTVLNLTNPASHFILKKGRR